MSRTHRLVSALQPRHIHRRSHSCLAPINHYPWPIHSHPSPHQIFHLSPSASQNDIKIRYYDLVRIYHPDSPHNHTHPAILRRSRFQALSEAYDILRGKASARTHHHTFDDAVRAELDRRRRAQMRYAAHERARRRQPPSYDSMMAADDAWQESLLILFGILALTLAVISPTIYTAALSRRSRSFGGEDSPTHAAAARNLAQVQRDAKKYASERRREIKNRVKAMRLEEEAKTNPRCGE